MKLKLLIIRLLDIDTQNMTKNILKSISSLFKEIKKNIKSG